ncbi:MAG TPA: PH domain-containing protein [Candidatus Saccharimonadales bacterium]|nr:PH domain-containing protein [Candidatus Saccharimonadales bacterium]
MSVIEAQLTKLGVRKTFFCKPEIRELQHILMDDEDIIKFVNGRYAGGFAILVATEQRLLLIDKKPLYLTVEDIRYDMISEVDVNSRLFDGTVTIFTVNRQLAFTSMRQRQLRELTAYVQKRVMEIRHYGREVSPAPKVAQPELPQMPTQQTDPYVPTMASTVTHSLAAHMPHVPAPISDAVAHTRDYLPDHLPQAIGSTATRLASRLQQHNNPYTKAPLMVRQRWSNWSNP